MARTLLHVGCGARNPEKVPPPFRGAEWREIRLDIDPSVEPDVVASITAMPEVAADSIDAVVCAHSLEHLYAHEVPLALREFRRVLRTSGVLLVVVPDLTEAAALIAKGLPEHVLYEAKAGPITAYDVVFGYTRAIARGATQMAHRSGFVPRQLMRAMEAAGFGGKKWMLARHNIWALGFRAGRRTTRRGCVPASDGRRSAVSSPRPRLAPSGGTALD
ncbi:MAG: methyltransferase domain-containing protein [Alphaproteobacteria bacterium]|nr:methyltransferase domain-containing protein [Alphaproteobacteria bacterium]